MYDLNEWEGVKHPNGSTVSPCLNPDKERQSESKPDWGNFPGPIWGAEGCLRAKLI